MEHQILRCAKIILASMPASRFRCRRHTLERWDGKIAKGIGTRLSALNMSIFEGRLAELLRFGPVSFHFGRKSHAAFQVDREIDRQRQRDRQIER